MKKYFNNLSFFLEYLYLINKINRHPTSYFTKNQYSKLIEKYYMINEYNGTEKQYEEMSKSISKESYEKYIKNVKINVKNVPSSSIELLKRKIVCD